MTKNTNTNSRRNSNNSARGGRVTKQNGKDASVAPEGTESAATEDATVEQPAEVAQSQAEEPVAEDHKDPVEPATTDDGNPATEAPVEAPAPEVEQPAESGEPEAPEAPEGEQPAAEAEPVDPFADLPMTTVEDYEFRDFTTATTSDPRKYESVQKAAIEGKIPVKPNWRHRDAMITTGTHVRDFKPGSVWGTIHQVVSQYGRAGVPAYVLVAKVRQLQIGNKRSHYCTALPPIGWAEGWIDSYISKSYGKVMTTKKAPPLTAEVKAEVAAIEAQTEVLVEKEQRAA